MSQRETPAPVPAIVPARMLNEFTYCPRLAYLMWVQQEWAENVETLEGKHAHRRVDRETGERAKVHDRSVQLTSTELGLTAVLDLIERDGRRARPVDYKRGKRPPVSGGAYEPERVQLCAQGLLQKERLVVESADGARTDARLVETSQLVLMGGARCSMPVLHECCRREIPVVHMSGTGWLYGVTRGLGHKNVELRSEQFAAARDSERSLAIGRAVVAAKIRNARVLLRRNGRPSRHDLQLLACYARRALEASDGEELLGLEGNTARIYYGSFSSMLKVEGDGFSAFDFEGRNRRPPRDPINALLSFAYSLLTKDWVVTLTTVGLDPLMGFYHQPRYGKPALALDLMEPFRPVIADSVVVGAVNNGELRPGDFFEREGGVLLRPPARKRLIAAYERRLAQKVRHPLFSYRCSYRRLFELEARLLSRHLLGEIPEYRPFETR